MIPEEEERGWQAVQERWTEDEAHRAWLAGLTDLEGLGRAGQRYRAWLVAHPDDKIAARWRDEVLKRAMVRGLASLPKTKPPTTIPRWLKWAAISTAATALSYALYWVVQQLLAASPGP